MQGARWVSPSQRHHPTASTWKDLTPRQRNAETRLPYPPLRPAVEEEEVLAVAVAAVAGEPEVLTVGALAVSAVGEALALVAEAEAEAEASD